MKEIGETQEGGRSPAPRARGWPAFTVWRQRKSRLHVTKARRRPRSRVPLGFPEAPAWNEPRRRLRGNGGEKGESPSSEISDKL